MSSNGGKRGHQSILFDVPTPLGFSVRCTKRYWQFISTEKHPSLKGKEKDIITLLKAPEEVRKSRSDPNVFLFYGSMGKKRWLCAVTKKENDIGFIVTAYPTDSIKIGEQVWKKSK